jgi:PmbA protein
VVALADADGETKAGVGSAAGRDPEALDLGLAAADAVRRAVEQFGAAPVPSTSLTVVLDPRMAATVVSIAAGMLTGERVVKGRSPFADRLGEAIASPVLSFVDDPTDSASMGADTYDGEGLACRRNELVRGGVLSQFLHNSYTGRRSGSGSTASAVRGIRSTPGVGVQVLVIEPGSRSFDDLVASVDHGVVVRSMTGLHSGVNAVSGDFSVGIEGHLIRNGTLAEPVREVTIASTIQRLLLAVREVGADFEWLPGGTGSCSLVIDDVALSGS